MRFFRKASDIFSLKGFLLIFATSIILAFLGLILWGTPLLTSAILSPILGFLISLFIENFLYLVCLQTKTTNPNRQFEEYTAGSAEIGLLAFGFFIVFLIALALQISLFYFLRKRGWRMEKKLERIAQLTTRTITFFALLLLIAVVIVVAL